MIQDIFPHVLNNQYDCSAKASSNDSVISVNDAKILVNDAEIKNNKMIFPKVKDFKNDHEFRYLFSVDGNKYYLLADVLESNKNIEIPDGFSYLDDRAIRTKDMSPDYDVFAAVTGRHLSDWYRDTRFCGRCGQKMIHSDKERAMVCSSCGYHAYPRIMPAVIVGVINGDKILITRYRVGYAHNALIAGFTEIGETVEETVAREVMEEAGVKVKNIRYYKSQPWGVANDILLGFYCDVDGDDTISMDASELKFAQWLHRDEIELQPDNFSLTNEMMRRFKNREI